MFLFKNLTTHCRLCQRTFASRLPWWCYLDGQTHRGEDRWDVWCCKGCCWSVTGRRKFHWLSQTTLFRAVIWMLFGGATSFICQASAPRLVFWVMDMNADETFGSHVGSYSFLSFSFSLSLSAILMLNSYSLSGRRRNNHQAQHSVSMPGRKWPGQLLAIQPETLFGWPTLWQRLLSNVTLTALFLPSSSSSGFALISVLKYCTQVQFWGPFICHLIRHAEF